MGLPFDHYLNGKVIPNVSVLTADRTLYLPDADLALDQLRTPLAEGFESATFPPSSPASAAWATPSPRYPSDQPWFRDTSAPLVGSASANRKALLADGQNSSMGCTLHVFEPGRFEFVFKCISEDWFDFGRFYIDGVEMLKVAGGASPGKRGRYVSQVLQPGSYSMDWRFTKDGSVTTAGELFLIDAVKFVRESQWTDRRLYVVDETDFTAPHGTSTQPLGWYLTNTGTASQALQAQDNGVYGLSTGATAASVARLERGSVNWIKAAHGPRWEVRLKLGGTGAQYNAHFGLSDLVNNEAVLTYTASLSGNWRLKLNNAGVSSYVDLGLAPDNAWHTWTFDFDSTNGLSVMYDGKCVTTAGSQFYWHNTNIPSAAMRPYFAVQNGSAADASLYVDFWRLWATRQ